MIEPKFLITPASRGSLPVPARPEDSQRPLLGYSGARIDDFSPQENQRSKWRSLKRPSKRSHFTWQVDGRPRHQKVHQGRWQEGRHLFEIVLTAILGRLTM